jgi:TRAP-type C4-dicarboxylate transport system substrate-binding protein
MRLDRRSVLKAAGSVGAAAATGMSLSSSALAQDKVTWKAVTTHRVGAAWSHRWPWLLEEIKTKTNGRLVFDVTTLPELGLSGQELLRTVRANLVDYVDIVAGYVGGDFPAIEAPQLPGVFLDYSVSRKAVDAWVPKVIEPRQDIIGGRVISHFNYNTVYLFTKNPLQKLEDIRGKKIRTFSVGLADFVAALGGEPVSMPVADLYTGLERGTIEGGITGPDQVEGQRLYEVCKGLTDIMCGSSPAYTVISKRSWDRLPADMKKVIEELAPTLTTKGWEIGDINNTYGVKLAQDKGMTVLTAPKPEWVEPLRKIGKEVVAAKWSKRVGPEVTKQFNEILGPIAGITI